MVTVAVGSCNPRKAASCQGAILKRAVIASLTMLALIGGGYAWQHASSARTAQRAEQARINALQMTKQKAQALEREAMIAAAAKAYAERPAAEKAWREMPPAAQPTTAMPRAAHNPKS